MRQPTKFETILLIQAAATVYPGDPLPVPKEVRKLPCMPLYYAQMLQKLAGDMGIEWPEWSPENYAWLHGKNSFTCK